MKPDELRRELEASTPVVNGEVDDEAGIINDDDFWEAIELLEASRDYIKTILKYHSLGEGRRIQLEGHCDELKQFMDNFVVGGDE